MIYDYRSIDLNHTWALGRPTQTMAAARLLAAARCLASHIHQRRIYSNLMRENGGFNPLEPHVVRFPLLPPALPLCCPSQAAPSQAAADSA